MVEKVIPVTSEHKMKALQKAQNWAYGSERQCLMDAQRRNLLIILLVIFMFVVGLTLWLVLPPDPPLTGAPTPPPATDAPVPDITGAPVDPSMPTNMPSVSDSNNPTQTPTTEPTQIPSTSQPILSEDEVDDERRATYQEILKGTDKLEVQLGEYKNAVEWLAKYDKNKAKLEDFKKFGDDDKAQLKERFALVLLHYSTGSILSEDANFLSARHVCDDDDGWNEDGIGAFCSGGESVTLLKLGKLPLCFVKVWSHHVLIDRTFHCSQPKAQGNSPNRDKVPFKSKNARVERQLPNPLPVESEKGC
jgi:hypothetical protein